jgi:hypothetical protein
MAITSRLPRTLGLSGMASSLISGFIRGEGEMEQCRELWEQHKGSFDSLGWPNWEGGSRVKYLQSGNKNLRLQEFTTEFIDPTWCEKMHVGFVVRGELEIDFYGRLVRYPEGSEINISAGSANRHKGHSIMPTVLLFLVEDI